MIVFIYGLLFSTILFLSTTIYFWRKSKLVSQRPDSAELQDFLVDLLAGGSLVHVKRIAPADALIHVRHKR
jgi:hypothetical protein